MALFDILIVAATIGVIAFNNLKKFKKNKNVWRDSTNSTNDNSQKSGFDDIGSKINLFIENLIGKNNFNLGNFKGSLVFLTTLLVVAFLWLASGIYIVQPDQEGVETRLGKYLMTTLPGLHYHLPYPIETVTKLPVTAINTEEIGYRLRGSDDAQVYLESTMVTKDENIIDINFDVQWRINNASEYLFNMRTKDINNTIRFAAESVMRDIIGKYNMTYILGEGRAIVPEDARRILQLILDSYKIGVHIRSIPIKKIDPPARVIAAFRDVQSAKADREREINMAQAYRNDVIPRAKGEAAKIVNEAESYYYQVVNKAKGEVAKMMSLYPLYKENKELTKTRLYTELMNDVFADTKKIIVSSGKNGQNVNLMNMGDLVKTLPNMVKSEENKD